MLKQLRKLIFISALVLAVFLSAASARAEGFDPNLIISNEEMMDHTAMGLGEIQAFLESKNSFLARYTCPNFAGVYKSAAEIIYDAAANNYDCDNTGISPGASLAEKRKYCRQATINPKLLLVLLQKEQSLIEDSGPSERALDWATGYGCPDNQACNDRWRGFGKQVNSAALQFFDYLVNPHHYSYRAGVTYTVTNTGRPPSVITPQNHATAALYNYTPHVYNGNYNFHKLWMRYFTFSYLDGSLLQAKGEPGVWLIQKGKKRPLLSRGALTSRFDIEKIIPVNKADLDRYPDGDPIKFAQYSLVRSPRGTVFLLVDDQRRGFASQEAFRRLGYHPDEIIDASWEEINSYEEVTPITATTSYPMGALLQDKKTGGVYYVFNDKKAPLWDAVLLKTKFKRQAVFPVDSEKLAAYQTVEPAIFSDGELLKSTAKPAVYVVAGRKKHAFVSGEAFQNLGYKWSNIISVPDKILALYDDGEPLSDITEEEAGDTAASGTPACLDGDGATASSCPAAAGQTGTDASTSKMTASTSEEIMEYYDTLENND